MYRLSRPRTYAGAAGDAATAETLPGRRERTRVSADGRWWWNGRRWVATTTEDGLWRWDGGRWLPTIDLAGSRPRDLACSLTLLAEDRYARAAAILAERAGEWGPPRELRALADRVRHRSRMQWPDRMLAGHDGPDVGALLRRLAARGDEPPRPDGELAFREDERRSLLLRLGRAAPSPTVKEADELLVVARLLEARAVELTSSLAAMDEAELARARAVGAAQRALAEAEDRRQRALAAGRRALNEAEERHAEARREALERLLRVLAPPPGELLAAVGPLRAGATSVETPAGRLPVEALRATAASAAALWGRHRDVLLHLLAAGSPEAEELLACVAETPGRVFVLLEGRSRTVLWPCPDGEEEAAAGFALAVRRRARAAARQAAKRAAALEEAREAATALRASSPRELARDTFRRLEADPALIGPVAEAREGVRRALQDPPELAAARARLAAALGALSAPPAPLG